MIFSGQIKALFLTEDIFSSLVSLERKRVLFFFTDAHAKMPKSGTFALILSKEGNSATIQVNEGLYIFENIGFRFDSFYILYQLQMHIKDLYSAQYRCYQHAVQCFIWFTQMHKPILRQQIVRN